jgi:hypothetical protein
VFSSVGCRQIVLNLAQNFLTDCSDDLHEWRLPPAIAVGARQCYELIATKDLAELAGIEVEPGGFAGLVSGASESVFSKSVAAHDFWPAFTLDKDPRIEYAANRLDALECLLLETLGEPAKRSEVVDGVLHFLRSPTWQRQFTEMGLCGPLRPCNPASEGSFTSVRKRHT